MYSILYESQGMIFKIGPFDTEEEAMEGARSAAANEEFDIDDQNVYLMTPEHALLDISAEDLGIGTQYPVAGADADIDLIRIFIRSLLEISWRSN